jgi:hypothetical protein
LGGAIPIRKGIKRNPFFLSVEAESFPFVRDLKEPVLHKREIGALDFLGRIGV